MMNHMRIYSRIKILGACLHENAVLCFFPQLSTSIAYLAMNIGQLLDGAVLRKTAYDLQGTKPVNLSLLPPELPVLAHAAFELAVMTLTGLAGILCVSYPPPLTLCRVPNL